MCGDRRILEGDKVSILDGKTVLVTGGTGSFGQKFTEIVLREHSPQAIRIFSRGELLQQQMRQKFNDDERLRFFIGDVRDRERLYRAMGGVEIVIHTAALKQVPTCEYNPIEAVRTNIDGATNVISTAIDNGVNKIISISTDKAVQPVNMYGATKLVSEKLFVQGNAYTGWQDTKFGCVRYGNVVGSRGSVIPIFLEQRKSGTITLTDERMTRFWITLEQGVQFVIFCLGRMRRGEIFIPKIPSMKITDLASTIAPQAKRRIIGIRPGEKVHEVLLTSEEAMHSEEFDSYFVILPRFAFLAEDGPPGGKLLPNGVSYTSDGNSQWLTREELSKIVAAEEY